MDLKRNEGNKQNLMGTDVGLVKKKKNSHFDQSRKELRTASGGEYRQERDPKKKSHRRDAIPGGRRKSKTAHP